LGRAPDCGLVLESATVSGRHAILSADPRGYLLRDNDSRNGVFVNGQRVREAVLSIGDAFSIGPFDLVVRVELSDVRVRLDWQDPHSGQAKNAVHRLPL